jgi:hypothetical protein
MFTSIKTWFNSSEVIFWARAQVVVGAVWTALSASDLSPLLDPKWLTYWLIANGIVTELLRRRGTEYRDGHLRDKDDSRGAGDTLSPGDVQGR